MDARHEVVDATRKLVTQIKAIKYHPSVTISVDDAIRALKSVIQLVPSKGAHLSTVLSLVIIEASSYTAVSAVRLDLKVLQKGGVSIGDDIVWAVGDPPGHVQVYDTSTNTVVFSDVAQSHARCDNPLSSLLSKRPWIHSCCICQKEEGCWSDPYPDPLSGRLI
jgi:hypothetical protein